MDYYEAVEKHRKRARGQRGREVYTVMNIFSSENGKMENSAHNVLLSLLRNGDTHIYINIYIT